MGHRGEPITIIRLTRHNIKTIPNDTLKLIDHYITQSSLKKIILAGDGNQQRE